MKIIIQQLSLGNQKIIGSTYEYYVKGLDGSREFTSDTKSATITTGVKKYKYAVNTNLNKLDKNSAEWREADSIRRNRKDKCR